MATRQRRSLWSDIFQSAKVNNLTLPAALLYTWAIANFDDYGFQEADPRVIKGIIFPKRDDLTVEKIEKMIEEIVSTDNNPPLWRIYCIGQETFIQDPVWFERQSFRGIHKKPSKILKLLTEHQIDTRLTPDMVQEGCGNGVLSEDKDQDKDQDKDKGKDIMSVTPDAVSLAKFLLLEILKWFPKFKQPLNLNGWSKSIDEMMRLDKRDPKEIRDVIVWCQRDNFWRKNILSGTTLRLKFNRLLAETLSQRKGKRATHSGAIQAIENAKKRREEEWKKK